MIGKYTPTSDSDIKGIVRLNPGISVSASGNVFTDIKPPKNVFNDKLNGSCWYSPLWKNEQYQSKKIKFKNRWIFLNNYSIQAPTTRCSTNYKPKSWFLQGKNKGTWVNLSYVSSSGLTKECQIKTFDVDRQTNAYNEFRFTNLNIGCPFAIQALDFFGVLIGSKYTYMRRYDCLRYLLIFMFLCITK